ncbi:MAG: ABC transporter permease DevC, partial [Cyanobacteria bacterium P01_A01_bin.68]
MLGKIPLAWLQLKRERSRLLIALAGIAFANILIFMQLGFRDSLYFSNVRFHQSLQGDIVLVSSQSNALLAMESFSQRRLYQTLDLPEVDSVHPIYLGYTNWKNPYTGRQRSILVIGFNPKVNIFNLEGININAAKLKLPDVVLFDRTSRQEYGAIAQEFEKGNIIRAEVRRRLVRVTGLFTLGASFGADGNLITSDINFLRIFNSRRQGLIEIGLIKLKPGNNAELVANKLKAYIGEDIKVFTKEEFI